MRYALISDIHSNYEALTAALESISKDRIDQFICMGDVVGYGADPVACIRAIIPLNIISKVAGNHDWAVLGLINSALWYDAAKEAILWTRDAIDKDEEAFLRSFTLTCETAGYSLAHGSLSEPARFDYIIDDFDAFKNMKLMNTPLCFVGHSHLAGIFFSCGRYIKYTTNPLVNIHEGEKYIINPGSIGQPRDSDPRASYAIYDEDARTVEIKRVGYDIEACQRKILSAGLPGVLAERLAVGR